MKIKMTLQTAKIRMMENHAMKMRCNIKGEALNLLKHIQVMNFLIYAEENLKSFLS